MSDSFVAAMELKLAVGDVPGEIEGYGSVFGNEDSHTDTILPGAFNAALAEHKTAGTMPTFYVMHGPALGGSLLPDGVWTEMDEDSRGLRVKGRISALDTDHGRRIRSLVQDQALRGLSIGFKVGAGNSESVRTNGKAGRRIKSFDKLYEVSLVTDPSNNLARVSSIKSLLGLADKEKAVTATQSAISLFGSTMAGGDSPSATERADLLNHLQDAHEALTGQRMPPGVKAAAPTTIREMERALREMGFSHSQATEIAGRGFKAAHPRDEEAQAALKDGLRGLQELSGFSLPRF